MALRIVAIAFNPYMNCNYQKFMAHQPSLSFFVFRVSLAARLITTVPSRNDSDSCWTSLTTSQHYTPFTSSFSSLISSGSSDASSNTPDDSFILVEVNETSPISVSLFICVVISVSEP